MLQEYPPPAEGPGDFEARPVPKRIMRLPALLQAVETKPDSLFVVDVRERAEFDGSAPFGESAFRVGATKLHLNHACDAGADASRAVMRG